MVSAQVDSAEPAKGRAKVPPRPVSAAPGAPEPVSAAVPPFAVPSYAAPTYSVPTFVAPTSAPVIWQPEPSWRPTWTPDTVAPPFFSPAMPVSAPGGFATMLPPPTDPDTYSGQMPRTLKAASILLGVNLLLTVAAALLSILISDELIALTLGHEPLPSDQAAVDQLEITFLVRAWGNVIVALIYAFLIWQLFSGRRSAWRRLVWLSIFGMAGVAYLLFLPYPLIFHVGQLAQILVLFAMFALAVHPQSRAWCQRKTR